MEGKRETSAQHRIARSRETWLWLLVKGRGVVESTV